MTFTDEHYAVTIATIAQVEASGNYGTITAPDTLSLGIGQWTQGRAWALLKEFPAGTDFGSTVNGWLGQAQSTWTIAARKYQYLSAADRSALSAALSSDAGRKVQDKTMRSDIKDSYLPRCRELGLDPDTSPDAAILLMVVMHRWGNYGRILPGIVASAGNPATIASMENAIRYSGEYAMVPGRYKTAFYMVENHITNGVDVSQDSGDDGNDAATGSRAAGGTAAKDDTAATVTLVRDVGDGTLSVTLGDGTVATVYPTSVGYWTGSPAAQVASKGVTPVTDSSSDAPTGDSASTGTTDERIKKMTAEATSSQGKYVYHQWFLPRLSPDKTGVTDCSGWCWYLMNKYLGIDIDRNGTGAIMTSGTGKVIASGSGTFNAADKIREGDLIVCRWFSGGGHVEYCISSTQCVGARGPDGASEVHAIANPSSMFKSCDWKLKRYV